MTAPASRALVGVFHLQQDFILSPFCWRTPPHSTGLAQNPIYYEFQAVKSWAEEATNQLTFVPEADGTGSESLGVLCCKTIYYDLLSG